MANPSPTLWSTHCSNRQGDYVPELSSGSYEWVEDLSAQHRSELLPFRRAIRRAGEQFGFYICIARKELHEALAHEVVQAGIDEVGRIYAAEWDEGPDLASSVEMLLQAQPGAYEGLVFSANSLVDFEDGRLVSSLNLARERLARVVQGPLVLCLTPDAYAALPDLASDLWSARSAVFELKAATSLKTRLGLAALASASRGSLHQVSRHFVDSLLAQAHALDMKCLPSSIVFRWQQNIRFLADTRMLSQPWVRITRQLADRAEELEQWQVAYSLRETELLIRMEAKQEISEYFPRLIELAERSRNDWMLYSARELASNNAMGSPDGDIARLRVGSMPWPKKWFRAVQQLTSQIKNWNGQGDGRQSLSHFVEFQLLPAFSKPLWALRCFLEKNLLDRELALGLSSEAAQRIDAMIREGRTSGDSLQVALWHKFAALNALEPSTLRKRDHWKHVLKISQEHQLHVLASEAENHLAKG